MSDDEDNADDPVPSSSTGPKSKSAEEIMTLHMYDEDMAVAFQSDCETLLLKYKEKDSFEFEQFAETWVELGFTGIFAGEDYLCMLETFLDNCFFVAKRFLFADDLRISIGAIYLLYSLHSKQPVKKLRQVRLLKEEVERIQYILQLIVPNKFYDALFIYNKMRLESAFHYVATAHPVGPTTDFIRRQKMKLEPIFRTKTTVKCLNELKVLLNDAKPFFQEMADVETEYQNLMKTCAAECPDLVPATPSRIHAQLQNHCTALLETHDRMDKTNEEQTIQTRRAQIRKKAMGFKDNSISQAADVKDMDKVKQPKRGRRKKKLNK